MSLPEKILKHYWGFDHFKPLQGEIITNILNGHDTLAVLPTGAGKSLCYQVPAIAMDGLGLVISPLIALMQDQVARLKKIGIQAQYIHAGMTYYQVKTAFENMVHGPFKLLYVSPERLQSELFLEYLPHLNINLVAVDEAHCISQWGYGFRPDYLKIAFLRQYFNSVPFIALTASATKEVQKDIIKELKLRQPIVFKQSIERNNIVYEVHYSENKKADLLKYINPEESGIVYCRSRKQTEVVAKYLQDCNLPAQPYHAGMAKDKRATAQQQWMDNMAPIMTATTAFGMGIDKPDVRTVVHYDIPEYLENYYQEAGRGGRDGKKAMAVTLYNNGDIKKLVESIDVTYPGEPYLRAIYQAVAEYLQIPAGTEPMRYFLFDLADFCKRFKFQALPASNALKLLEQEGLWSLSDSVFLPSTVYYRADRSVLDQIAGIYPDLHYISTGLLRLYGTLFHYPTPVRLTLVANQLKMKVADIEQALDRMAKMGVLEYNKQEEGPQLFFSSYRVESSHLMINIQRINNLKRRHKERIDAMIAYLQNETLCRERALGEYFEETITQDCGRCDICQRKQVKLFDKRMTRQELISILYISGSLRVAQVTEKFPPAISNEIIALIRQLIDEKVFTLSENGLISLK